MAIHFLESQLREVETEWKRYNYAGRGVLKLKDLLREHKNHPCRTSDAAVCAIFGIAAAEASKQSGQRKVS